MRIVLLGALGEVGTHLNQALTNRGHQVTPVSSRSGSAAVSYPEALALLESGAADLVVNAGGRGDRRAVERSGLDATRQLASITTITPIPAILISTTRVLEADPGVAQESDAGAATTEYALANLENEAEWLSLSQFTPRVLRLTNFFAEPLTPGSGQSSLLPWSLVTDALATGSIAVRSDSRVSREFVDAASIASALDVMVANVDHCPPRVATAPGTTLSLQQLCDCIAQACVTNGMQPPVVSFGHEMSAPARVEAQWLNSHGWTCELTPDGVTKSIVSYLVQRGT